MTRDEVYNAAYKKAKDNGWIPKIPEPCYYDSFINEFVFDISFLKAFFGEQLITKRRIIAISSHFTYKFAVVELEETERYYCNQWHSLSGVQIVYLWQYHAQQLILEEDRLAYLERFL